MHPVDSTASTSHCEPQRTMEDKTIGPAWWREMCAGHLRWLARKGRRSETLRTYGCALDDFGGWLDSRAIADAQHLTGGELERWQDSFAGRAAASTHQVYAAAVRGALRWAATQEPPLCPPTLWLRVSTPHTAQLLPKPIPRANLERVIAVLAPRPRAEDLVRLRTRALFFVIFSAGVRISEALQLERDQLQDRTATVIQKGGRQKLIVISEAAESAVDDYLQGRRDSYAALFIPHDLGRRGRPISAERLGPKDAQRAWDQLCVEVGIPRFTNHQIRHTCATELLRQHVDSLIIAKHLGHRGLQSIAGYAEVGLDARHEMLEVLDARSRGGTTPAPASSDDEPRDEVRSVSDVFLELRWNLDNTGAVTRDELFTFARLTRRPDLMREAAMSAHEFAALVTAEGGEYPLPAGRLTVLPDPV